MTRQTQDADIIRPEEALFQSEARYRTLFDHVFEGIAHCRMLFEEGQPQDFIYLEVNRAFEELTGLKNVVGKRVTEVIPGLKESQPELLQAYGRVALTGEPAKFEIYVEALKEWFFVSVYSTEQGCFTAVFENITQRKQAAEALRESEHRYRLLFNSISDAAFVHEEDRARGTPPSFIEVNDLACQRLGYTREELLRLGPAEIEAVETQNTVAKVLEKVPGGQPVVQEGIHVAKSGRRIRVEISSRLFHLNGKATYLSTARDITERKQTEEALRKSEENFRGIFEHAPVGIYQSTIYRFVAANPMLARMFGYKNPAEMAASVECPAQLFVNSDQERDVVRQALESETVVQRQVELLRKDRSTFAADLRMRAVRDEKGKFKAIEAFVEDLTERNRAEDEALKMSRALEQSPVTIVITDPSGNIEYVNPAFTRQTGYTREEALGKNCRILKSGKTAPEEYQRLWQAITHGQEWRGEFLNKAKDGRLFWESAVISPIVDTAGRIAHFLAVKEDITQRKNLEEQLRQAQKMEAVGQLAGGIAHDFNNILVATLMHLGLLQENPQLSAEIKKSLKEVEKETVRAANLTRQLLLFSRRQAARIEPLDINVLIHNLLKMLQRLLGENIEIISQVSSDAIWISADAGMMEQVVMNLCINARDAMSKGGRLTLATTEVDMHAHTPKPHADARTGRFVCLSVSDTGCGMDDAVLKRIFEPFFTTKEVGKGTGLGLATVYGIVKQHDGWVEVESAVGQGSSFRVYFPAAKPPGAFGMASHDEEIKGGSETILVVEDEVYVRRLVTLCLRKLGYVVLEAGDGLEALKVWEQHREKIALLFTDMVMSGSMTGLDLAARLMKEKESLKVISSSGYQAELTGFPLTAGREIAYLPKPYAPIALAKIVRRCLDKP